MNLNECTKLDDEEQQLSEIFGESPPQGKKYYTLVKKLPFPRVSPCIVEAFVVFMADAVRETLPRSQTWLIPRVNASGTQILVRG